MFTCCDGVMILASKQCNGYTDCKDGSDEFYCDEGNDNARWKRKNTFCTQLTALKK